MRSLLTLTGIASLAWCSAALAVSDRDVARFVQLSERFNAKLARPETAGLNAGQLRFRGKCILERLEQSHGGDGVAAVMSLMQVLSTSAEFDDPTVVSFNATYGSAYKSATRECLNQARAAG